MQHFSQPPNFPSSLSPLQGKIIAQGRLLLQDTFMVLDPEGGLLGRMKERRVFLFEQMVIFSEPLDKKKGFSLPGFLYKNSIKVTDFFFFKEGKAGGWQRPLVEKIIRKLTHLPLLCPLAPPCR